ncbi:MAG: NAD-dependent epimerase/dehydratase family protein [Geminicoccaceae bacterium]
MMLKWLVTGGCGFIGAHLCAGLVADQGGVCVLDVLATGEQAHLPPGVGLLEADLRDPTVAASAMAGVDACFHLAAVASVARCNQDWHHSHLANSAGTVAVLEAAARAGIPVVYASSAAVYGDNPDLPLAEDAVLRPLSPYGADKAANELQARAGARVHGLASVGLRFFNVYGPRQRAGDPYSGVISTFRDRLARREPLVLHGDGGQSRDFVYVGDVVRALLAAMAALRSGRLSGASVFNVCTGRAVSIAQLAETMMRLTGITVPIEHAPARAGDIRHSLGSPERAATQLGFTAGIGIEEGLRRLIAEQPQGERGEQHRNGGLTS